jgi:hypothetical protein
MESKNNGLRLPPPWIAPAAGKPGREVQPVITVNRRRPPAAPATGPLLFADFGNSASYPGTGTTLTNLGSVAGVSGTLTNGPVFSPLNGGTLLLDGLNDYVQFNNAGTQLVPTTGLTIIAWARSLNNDKWLVDGIGGNRAAAGYALAADGSALQFYVNNRPVANPGGNFNNQWGMFSGVWVPSTSMTLRRNGTVLVTANTTIPATIGTPTAPLRWGARATNQDYTNGAISIIKVIGAALSQAELAAEYETFRGRFGLPAL